MLNAHLLVRCGLMSVKDWIATARDIEDFRKQESGHNELPGDFLQRWLSEPAPESDAPITPMEPASKPTPRTAADRAKVARLTKQRKMEEKQAVESE